MRAMSDADFLDYLKGMQTFSIVTECSMRISKPKPFPEVNLVVAPAPETLDLAAARSKPLQVR